MNTLLELCQETCHWLLDSREPIQRRIKKDPCLRRRLQEIESNLNVVSEVYRPTNSAALPKSPIKAVAWNLERGKQFDRIVYHLTHDPDLKDADLYFFTEVDWGMFRSGNRSVAQELGKLLNLYTYFAPSYFNLTVGHGGEQFLKGNNAFGLHGKAILSRWPLDNLRTGPMSNLTNKLKSTEARIGQKRSLMGDIPLNGKQITVGCIHLDAFSSPRTRALQMKEALAPLDSNAATLIAGDWNTNTLDSRSGARVLRSMLYQLLMVGPRRLIRDHHKQPDLRFDRPLFRQIEELGFTHNEFNEIGIGTFDVLQNDAAVGAMARDQIPAWLVSGVHRIVQRLSNSLSLKLDWFAGKNIIPLHAKVVQMKTIPPENPEVRPSDHNPILLILQLK